MKTKDPNTLVPKDSELSSHQYKPTRYRYLIATLYSMVSILTAIMWISTSPITKTLQSVYDLNIFTVNFCTSMIWFLAYPPMNFLANYVLDEKGLRTGVLLGSVLCMIGLVIRVFSMHSFYYIFGGQLLGAIGQPFILNAPQKVSAVWFPPEERAIATTLVSIANPVGVGIGFLMSQMFVDNGISGNEGLKQVNNLMIFTAILGFCLILPSFFLFKNKPKVAPSKSADVEKYSYKQSLKQLFSNRSYMTFVIAMGFFWGSYNVLATVLQPLIEPYGFTESQSGNFGAATLVSGLIGSVVWGVYVNNTHKYKFSIIICATLSLVGLGGLAAILQTENIYLALLLTAFYGFFTTPVFAIAFEFCAEVSFPVAEAASSGLMVVMTQIGAAFGTVGIDAVLDVKSKEHTMLSFAILGVVSVIGFLLFIATKEDLRREKAENEGNSPTEGGDAFDNEKAENYEDTLSEGEQSGVHASLLIKKN